MAERAHRRGQHNAITDVVGIQLGHHHRLDEHWASGCTVVLTPQGAVTAVDVRGGGPGTRETDVLDPTHLVQQAHAVVLSGGSAYGLAAADGAVGWLEEHGHGFQVGNEPRQVVPIVPAAVLFDLPMSDWGNRPDSAFGYQACAAAGSGEVRQGTVGAGAGAVAGAVKGGVGTASVLLDDSTYPGSANFVDTDGESVCVGATVAVNPSGSVIDPVSGMPWAVGLGLAGEFDIAVPEPAVVEQVSRQVQRPSRHSGAPQATPENWGSRPLNTTIGVVATDVALTKAESQRVAVAAQDGLARAIRPAHGMTDGDTIFAMSTARGGALPPAGSAEWAAGLNAVCSAAADVVARAVVHAVLAAGPVGDVMPYTHLYRTARE